MAECVPRVLKVIKEAIVNQLQVMPAGMLACYKQQQHSYSGPKPEYPEDEDYQVYQTIDPKTIKDKITDLMGAVLARCWLDKSLMAQLERDPHKCLYEMGLILPSDISLVVQKEKQNRPQIVLYEDKKRICALQLRMLASL